MAYAFAKIAFTPTVRAQQERLGSGQYGRFLSDERTGGDRLSAEEAAFIQARDGFYQASVSEGDWPYVQFRGGPRGFLNVLDDRTIAYADLRGNRQYISLGNLTGNDRVSLILMDYPNARRLKIWGRVRVLEADAALAHRATAPLMDKPGAERVVAIGIEAFDWNCPRHIPRRLTEEEAAWDMTALRAEAEALRFENAKLREAAAP